MATTTPPVVRPRRRWRVDPDDRPAGASAPGWLLMRFSTQMHAISARFAVRRSLHLTDVTAMAVLAAARRPLTAGQLAAELQLSTGATTRLIDRLEASGHLARTTDPEDKRRRLVSITPTAATTARSYFGQLGQRVDAVLEGFAPPEREVVTRFLAELVEVVAEDPVDPVPTQAAAPPAPGAPPTAPDA